MAALTRLFNIRIKPVLAHRVALSGTAARASISPIGGISQNELAKTRNYLSPATNPNSYFTHRSSTYAPTVEFNANAPLRWVGHVQFAGLGGFWPLPYTPLVAFFFFMLFNFLFQWNTCEEHYEANIEKAATVAGMTYVKGTKGSFKSSRNAAPVAPASGENAAAVDTIYGIKKSNPGNIMASCFTREYFNTLSAKDQARLLQCCSSGLNNPTSELGAYAMNPTDYDDFYKFFKCVLEKYHKVNLNETKHVNDWTMKGKEGLPADGVRQRISIF